ncbi:DNA repair ATPase [Rufibacter sp. LB8]|uniref:DNA repair ATPase n=1 Tax=Rufibacter sp. LB8 TaxID=2777781 RepID=UPI00178C1967|nr:DNA repair ATPase [Rufibacter sp. LB8]
MKSTRTYALVAFLLLTGGISTQSLAQAPAVKETEVAVKSTAPRSVVEETEVEINGITRKGQRILIQLDSKLVEKAWSGYLKDKSGGTVKGPSLLPTPKGQATKGIYTVEKAKIDTITANPMRIMSKVEGTQDGTVVWWTMDMGNAYLSKKETRKEWERGEAMLQQFARQVYKQDVNQQIADAEKVLVNSQSEADRVVRQADEIKNKIAKNQQKKLELEAALVANAQELEQLNRDVETNLKQQEAAKQEVENMRRAVEIVKGKMDKIN